MRSVRLPVLALLLLALSPSPAAAQGQSRIPVVPMDRYQWLGKLVGACWKGVNAKGAEVETVCWSTQWDRILRATTRAQVPRGDRTGTLEGEMVVAWNPKNGQYDVARWNAEGSFSAAEATLHRGAFRFWTREKDGSDPKERTIWRSYGKDRYEVTLERRDGDRWRDVKTTTYEQVRPTP